jgi:hypothetical protein
MTQRPSRPFAARFGGTCSGCGWDLEEGNEIVMWNGVPYHFDEECCAGLRNQPKESEVDDPWA